MDRFGPTWKVSKKLVHLLRWSSFPGRTGLIEKWPFHSTIPTYSHSQSSRFGTSLMLTTRKMAAPPASVYRCSFCHNFCDSLENLLSHECNAITGKCLVNLFVAFAKKNHTRVKSVCIRVSTSCDHSRQNQFVLRCSHFSLRLYRFILRIIRFLQQILT